MLGYRSYVEVDSTTDDVIGEARRQLHAWLRSKKWDADLLAAGRRVEIATGVTASTIELDERDGTRMLGVRIVEESHGTWITELDVVQRRPGAGPSSVLVDVHAPDRKQGAPWTGTPRLSSHLLGALPAKDSEGSLRDRPGRIGMADVEALAEVICDDRRRGLVFVAGSDKSLPDAQWYGLVRDLLKDTTGLAASYFLDPTATAELTAILGESHGVEPGTVRTFLPEADPASELDSARHRILTTRRIVRDDRHHVRRVLGRRARERALEQPLPSHMNRARARLMERADQALLEGMTTALPTVAEIPKQAPTTDPPVRKVELTPGLVVLREVIGVAEPTEASWLRLAELAKIGLQAEQTQAEIAHRIADLRTVVAQGDSDRQLLRKRLEDEQLEHAATFDALQTTQLRVGRLQKLLVQTERAAEVYVDEPRPDVPESFADLMAQWEDLEEVPFTGDQQIVVDLDQKDPLGTWAAKSWRVLVCLRDYVRAKAAGLAKADVDHYLDHTPDGYAGWSANRHARDESGDVWNNRKFAEKRRFPVPQNVHQDGSVLMGAHFKVAQSGLISPRLHYHDDTHRSGKVYVGYLGPHLPTKQTN